MQAFPSVAETRQIILLQKEIPPLPLIAQRILSLPPDADVGELAALIEKAPEIAARLIGLANSAYFGWPGGVRTVYDAVYKVLGIKLVKSLVIGMALGSAFEAGKCPGFRPERYWFTAVVTAQMTQGLFPLLPFSRSCDLGNVHMNGLLHNLGIVVLAHVFPLELSGALSPAPGADVPSSTERIRSAIGVDHMTAGGWLARKWHLPRDIVCVMEHHKDPGYRGEFWPLSMLVGYCERRARHLYATGDVGSESPVEALLGIGEEAQERMRRTLEGQLEEIRSMVSLMATGE